MRSKVLLSPPTPACQCLHPVSLPPKFRMPVIQCLPWDPLDQIRLDGSGLLQQPMKVPNKILTLVASVKIFGAWRSSHERRCHARLAHTPPIPLPFCYREHQALGLSVFGIGSPLLCKVCCRLCTRGRKHREDLCCAQLFFLRPFNLIFMRYFKSSMERMLLFECHRI